MKTIKFIQCPNCMSILTLEGKERKEVWYKTNFFEQTIIQSITDSGLLLALFGKPKIENHLCEKCNPPFLDN